MNALESPQTTNTSRQRALALLQQHGRHATSFQLLEDGINHWFDRQDEDDLAVIGYVLQGNYRIVVGIPVADDAHASIATARFIREARSQKHNVLFFSADQQFIEKLETNLDDLSFDLIKIGEQPEWTPDEYSTVGASRRSLRSQINRAKNKGVSTRRVDDSESMAPGSPTRKALAEVLDAWKSSRRMSVMGFMVDVQPFELIAERRFYIAESLGEPVAFLSAVPIFKTNGWFFEDVIRRPDAPNGTTELLIDAAMRDAAKEGSDFVTLGLSPLAGVTTGPGPHRGIRGILRLCYTRLSPLYGFSSLRSFKARFHPDRWSNQYLVTVPNSVGIRALMAVLSAFAGGNMPRFALDTCERLLLRVPHGFWALALLLLGGLLIPWTLLLASLDGNVWFGDGAVQWAWVGLDAFIATAMLTLSGLVWRGQRNLQRLNKGLIALTTLNLIFAISHAIWMHHLLVGWLTMGFAIALAGPLLATLLLGILGTVMQRTPQNEPI